MTRQGKRDCAEEGWGRVTGSAGAGGGSGRKWAEEGVAGAGVPRWSECGGQRGSASENRRL